MKVFHACHNAAKDSLQSQIRRDCSLTEFARAWRQDV
jgi:hypothetical protein